MLKLTVFNSFLYIAFLADFALGRSCNPYDLVTDQCGSTQTCDEATKICICNSGFVPYNQTYCLNPKSNGTHPIPPQPTPHSEVSHKSGSVIAWIVAPLVLFLFVIFAVYANKKYNIVNWLRAKIRQRQRNYDEFMIGQGMDDDDPPLH